jgi:hypothetical protein
MARQTITISIPEELSKRLSRYKERLNVSKVCQDALTARIDQIDANRERTLKERKGKMGMITRLRQEKKEYEGLSTKGAVKELDRLLDEGALSYAHIRALLEIPYSGSRLEVEDTWAAIFAATDTEPADWSDDLEGVDRELYARAFLQRMHERWELELADELS